MSGEEFLERISKPVKVVFWTVLVGVGIWFLYASRPATGVQKVIETKGTNNLRATDVQTGYEASLGADIDVNRQLSRLYFANGNYTDFNKCLLNDNFEGSCVDLNGRNWQFDGVAFDYGTEIEDPGAIPDPRN